MKLVTTKTIAKIAAVATGLATFASVSTFALNAHAAALTSSQVSAIVSLLQSFGADSATIANVQASLTGQPTTTTTTTTTGSAACSFTTDLTVGSSGAAVTCLQNYLIASGFSIPAGATGYFGAQTVAAVSAWQKAHGVTPSAGYFGAISRAMYLSVAGSSTTTTTTGGGTVTVGSGNGLKVTLSPTSPSGTVLVQGQGIGDLADYVFANPTSAPITITGVTFNRIGVSNDQTINNVYLYNGVNRLTDSAGVSNSQFSFTNAGGLFTVAPGMTYTVSVRADIAGGTSGQQIGASLVSVASTGTLDSSDSFPINSGYQTISAANLAVVQFSSSANTLPSGTNLTVSPQSSYTVWQNSVSVSTNPVWVKSMAFTNLGSIDSNNIGNFRLYIDGNQVGTAVASIGANRMISFDLSANPVMLSTQSHIIKVLADITGGASLTFQFSLQRSSDALFVDSQLSQPVTPTVSGSTNFTPVNASQVTIQSVGGASGVSVSKDPTSASNAVSVGASNVNFATFNMLATGERTKVMDLYVCADTSVHNGGLKNGKVFFNGVQVGSTKDIAECDGTSNSTGSNTDFSLGSSLVLPAGQTSLISVYADAKTSTSTSTNLNNNESVTIKLVGQNSQGNANAQGQDSFNSVGVPGTSSDIAGNPVSVSSSALSASKFSGYANQTVIPGSQNALIGEFTLAAGSTEGINVNTIGIDASSTWNQYLQNLKLVDMSNNQQLGTTISTPSAGTNSFSLGSNLVIPQSGSKTIGIYANLLSTAGSASGSTALGVSASGTSGTGATTGNSANLANAVMLQTISASAGSLNAALGASNPVAANVIAGASSLQVGDFTFSAASSNYTIQKLQVDVPNAAAAAVTSLSVKYTDVNGAVQTATLSGASSVGSATTSYAFTGLNALVSSNSQADISVWISTPTISAGGAALSGLPISVTLNPTTGFQAQDQSGTLTTSITGYSGVYGPSSNANAGYGTLIVRKSIPTFTMLTNPNTTPAAGQSLYQFSVAADPAGAVDLDQVTLNVATSGPTITGLSLYDITSGSAVLVAGPVNAPLGVATFNFGSTTQQIGAGQSKTYELIASSVTGWTTSGSVSISLGQDTTYLANTNASAADNVSKIVWSDRSALNHSANAGSNDWTNGYLLKNFVNDVTSYTHS